MFDTCQLSTSGAGTMPSMQTSRPEGAAGANSLGGGGFVGAELHLFSAMGHGLKPLTEAPSPLVQALALYGMETSAQG